MAKIDLHVRFNEEEYNKIRTFAYYANKSKNEIVRIAIQQLKEIDSKTERKGDPLK